MEIWCVDVSGGIPEDYYRHWTDMVTPEKKARIRRFYRAEDRAMCLTGDIMARLLVQEATGLANEAIRFVPNRYGKPYLCGDHGCYFNISHSGTYVACAMDSEEIGVDIERIKQKDLLVAERFFSATEYKDLLAKDDFAQQDYFFELWALKESYVKCLGQGLSCDFASFSLRHVNSEIYFDTPAECRPVYFQLWSAIEGYKLAVCRSLPGRARLCLKSIDQLYEQSLRCIEI